MLLFVLSQCDCSGTCLPLKNRARFTDNTKNLGQACSGILVYFIELYRIVSYRIVKLKTKFTELKKANSQKQTYQKGEVKGGLKRELTLLAAS